MKSILSILTMGTVMIGSPAFSEVAVKQLGFPAAIDCGPGSTFMTFSHFGTSQLKVPVGDLPFSGTPIVTVGDGGPISGTRLDLCADSNDNYTLRRVIQRIPGPGFAFSFVANVLTVDHPTPDAGLKDALFGDASKLYVEFKNAADTKNSFLLKGVVLKDGTNVVTLSRFDSDSGNPLALTDGGRIRVGTLNLGDPWAPPVKTHSKRLVDAGDIKIWLDFNYSGKPGLYVSYDFNEITIDDKSPLLNPAFHYVSTGNQDPHTIALTSHHGLMDKFEFSFDHATYTLGMGQLVVKYENQPAKTIPLADCAEVYECGVNIKGK